jgi:2-polyprenyl-3-methyl-5-hydroxy-6-metoxy-1,4-benzoquinol methylase
MIGPDAGLPHRQAPDLKMDYWERLLEPFPGESFLEQADCPACSAAAALDLGPLGPSRLKRCSDCGLVYGSPRLSAATREALYRQNPGAMDPGLDAMLRRLMTERFGNLRREMFPLTNGSVGGPGEGSLGAAPAGSLFEIGSGWGHFLAVSKPHFAKVAGAELSQVQAAYARRIFGIDITESDIFAAPASPDHDVIAAWELIEHVPDPARVLAWAFANLGSGGQLALSTPNYASLYRRILGPRWFYHIPTQHLSYFSPAGLKALLLKQGFARVRIFTSGRSLLRERYNNHNSTSPGLDTRGRWLENLRIREAIERERDLVALDRGTFAKRIWHGAVWRLVNPLLRRGYGDQMRVYALKA